MNAKPCQAQGVNCLPIVICRRPKDELLKKKRGWGGKDPQHGEISKWMKGQNHEMFQVSHSGGIITGRQEKRK